jgi:hypothetical protein
MDGFFEPPSTSTREQAQWADTPPWTGRPQGAPLGAVLDDLLLARSARASVSVAYVDAYPAGFELQISACARVPWDDLCRPGDSSGPDVFGRHWPQVEERKDEIPAQLLRVAVRFADGRLASNISGHDRPVEGPVLWPLAGHGSGGGSKSSFSQGFWVSPLPPPGAVTIVCQWPVVDIPISSIELDGELILDGAERARAMFSEHSVHRDGRDWRLATDADVEWINAGTSPGMTITSSVPPGFDAYCTIVPPGPDQEDDQRVGHQQAVIEVLTAHTADRPWWLGYLDTGASDVVFPYAPRTTLYYGYGYVVVEAGPRQAAQWRDRDGFDEPLPDLIFPADRSWLLTTMWDDDWTCIGGTEQLIGDILSHPVLGERARRVSLGEDSTPPGHTAI